MGPSLRVMQEFSAMKFWHGFVSWFDPKSLFFRSPFRSFLFLFSTLVLLDSLRVLLSVPNTLIPGKAEHGFFIVISFMIGLWVFVIVARRNVRVLLKAEQ